MSSLRANRAEAAKCANNRKPQTMRFARLICVLAYFVIEVDAHGFLLQPTARQKGASDFSTAGTSCAFNSCGWFSNSVKIPVRGAHRFDARM